ncbi:MAG: ABC transporter ATP-binding protein, partial [Geminicoccales bacterium]
MALELRNLVKRVGAEIHIHETNLVLAERGFNILLGTTLSGKTTLMQLMAGIDRPTAGAIWFKGADVTGTPVQKRNVAMVYQQFINYPNFTVYENIASPLRVAGVPKGELGDRVAKVADLMRLTPMLKRMPSELSGGQQQRVAIARALVKDADLVLLDEPLANLDYKLREELRDELPKLFAGRDCTVVYATTEPGEALLLGGHTGLLHEGRIVQYGPTSEIYRRPENLLAAQVFSDPPINTADITKSGERIVMAGGLEWHVGSRLTTVPDGAYT